MPRTQRRLLIAGLMLLDVIAVTLAMLTARGLVAPRGQGDWFTFPWLPSMSVVAAIVFFAINRLYVLDELFEGPVEYGRVFYACTLTTFAISIVGYWGRDFVVGPPSRRLIAVVWIFSLLAAGGGRFLARRVVRALRRRGYLTSRVLIVGLGAAGISLARHFRSMRHTGMNVVGFIDDFLPPGTSVTDGLKVVGPPSALPRLLKEVEATEVIVVPTAMAWESFRDLMRASSGLNGYAIRLAPDFLDLLPTSVKVHRFGFTPLLTIERIRITGLDAVMKRMLDYGTGLVLLPLILPLVAVLGGALALTGVRPFRSLRVIGRQGVTFRTYLLNVNEPRNRLQHLVYQLGLDKLPQLFNVLRGRMSIVGPRPVPFEQRHEFERWIPNLLTVKPGITGLWAVRGTHGSLDDEMRLSVFYIRNYSIWLDLEILARSIIRLLGGRSALGGGEEAVVRERFTVHG